MALTYTYAASFYTDDSYTQIETCVEYAHKALIDGLYDEARHHARNALLMLGKIPDGQIGGASSQKFSRETILQFIDQVKQQEIEATQNASEYSFGIEVGQGEYQGYRDDICGSDCPC